MKKIPLTIGKAVSGNASAIVIHYACQACGRKLHHGCDNLALAEPYHLECRNQNCSFDGGYGASFAEAAQRCGARPVVP